MNNEQNVQDNNFQPHDGNAPVSRRLVPYYSSHAIYSDGGRKCHIGYYEEGKPICGLNHSQYTTSDVDVDDDWVLSGVYSGVICLKCAKKYVAIAEKSLDGAQR